MQRSWKKGKAEAERMAAEYLLSHKSSTSDSYTLREAMENVIAMKRNILSPSTMRTYKSLIKTAYPSIIDCKIDAIENKDIQRAMNDLALVSSPKHVRNAYGFFTSAVSAYYPEKRYTVNLPQRVEPNTYTPTDDEVGKVIKYFKDHDHEMLKAVYLAAFGTLRRGEICAAEASDIEGNDLYVHRSMVYDGQEWVMSTTKTEKSTRFVRLPDFVIKEMPKEGKLVSVNPTVITNRFIKAVKACGVKKFRFHDLRHYAATIMHTLGIPDQYIMRQGGWSSDAVLKRVYRGTMSDYEEKFADMAAEHFSKFK